jgi:hypothetical protein
MVKYKRRLWRVTGNSINLDDRPADGDDPFQRKSDVIAVNDEISDDGQQQIIDSAPEARLLVDAGPGTGKTHVACQKVAALVRNDIPASRIWIISFTRTAVREIRDRLAVSLEDAADAASVRIATLDSSAWSIQSGFSGNAVLRGTYDDNIQRTIAKVLGDEDVRSHLQRTRHLIIDEAQDIVGKRAEFVLSIIDALEADCGVTVFADQAQAIYGFTEDDRPKAASGIRLVAGLEARKFQPANLRHIHRTDSPTLLKIFTDVRLTVLDTKAPVARRRALVRQEITRLAHAHLGPAKHLKLSTIADNGLVLMRQRCDVLIASSYNQDIPHRLRMSGLPPRILPWVAQLLWDHSGRKLTRTVFETRWAERMTGEQGVSAKDAAWTTMFEAAGESDTVIDLHRLRSVLGRSNPPVSFVSPEYGDAGPIIGTIHASKGREAEEVSLYLPPEVESGDDDDADEEIRVLFVGATRARRKLSVGDSPGKQSSNAEGRVWKYVHGNRAQIEIGRVHDVDAQGLVGKQVFKSAKEALIAQQVLAAKPFQKDIFAFADSDLDWNLALETKQKERIGALSKRLKDDLTAIANLSNSWPPPNHLPFIRSAGLRTIALRPDDPALEQLHEPWRSSGFVLAPMLIGFSLTKLGKKKS